MFDASMPAIAGQVLWLDANDTATVLDAEGDNAASGGAFSGSVQTWQDKSGSGFHVTAAASTNRPTYTTGALNGLNALTFDGTTDWLRNTGATITGDDYTMFVVFNRTTATSRDAVFEMGNGSSRNAIFVNDTSGAGKINLYHNSTFYNPSSTYTANNYVIYSATINTNAYTQTQNGSTVATGTVPANRSTTTGIYVGNDSSGGDELQGLIAEIIIYDRDLSADERHDVETYLAGKWGLAITNAAPSVATNAGVTVNQGALTTVTSAMLSASDADNTDSSLKYTITDAVDRGTLFRDADSDGVIDAGETLTLASTFTQGDIDSGLIKYRHDATANYADAFSFTVTDQRATTAAATFSITITPLNNAPTLAAAGPFSINENVAIGTAVTTMAGSDSDIGQTLTYSIQSGNTGGMFAIDASTGALTFAGSPDYEAVNSYNLVIRVTDNGVGSLYAERTVAVNINNLNEGAPNIDGWTLISSEDFQGGATGWNDNTTTNGGATFTTYLGRFGGNTPGETITKSYALSSTQDYTIIEFDLYRIDDWDNEDFRLYIDGSEVFVRNFGTSAVTIASSSLGNVSWRVAEITNATGNLGHATSNDQIFRFTMTIQNNGNAAVSLGFGSDLNEAITNEAYGIDNVKVYEVGSAGSLPDLYVPEGTANAQAVFQLTASDPENDTISYSITGGTGSGIFSINASTGVISVSNTSLLDYESSPTLTLQVTATDSGTPALTDIVTLTIHVMDQNEAPTIPVQGPYDVAENSANGTVVATVTGASDPEGAVLVYSITSGNTDNIFAIDSATGEITVARNYLLNHEEGASYTLSVRVTDDGIPVRTYNRSIVINVTDSNEAPNFNAIQGILASTQGLQYSADTGNFYLYYDLASSIANARTYASAATILGQSGYVVTITSAAENEFVRLMAAGAGQTVWLNIEDNVTEGTWVWKGGPENNGVAYTGGATQAGYYTNWGTYLNNGGDQAQLRTDGFWDDVNGGTRRVIIEWTGSTLLAAYEQNTSFSIPENAALNTLVTTQTAYDADAGDTLTYSITGGTGSGIFSINSATGAVTLTNPGAINYESTTSYTLDLRVQDTAGLFSTRTITINISDVNETPTLGAAGPFSFNENIAAGTSVTTMVGSDVDAGQSLTYTIQSGNTGGMFAIDAATGALTFAGSPNFEAVSSYNLVIRVTDNGAGTLFAERTVTININDVNEAPVIVTNTGATINEGDTLVITSAMLDEGDPDDSGAGLTYTASGLVNGIIRVNGVTQNTFTQGDINAGLVEYVHNGGENIIGGFNFSLADGGEDGTTPATGTFSITVTPVNDAPVIEGWNLVSNEDFEGAVTGWTNNTTTAGNTYFSRYLGSFAGTGGAQTISKSYTLSTTQEYTVIEFDFMRLDSWDGEQFRIWVNDTQIFAQGFSTGATTISDGSSGVVSWQVSELTQITGNMVGANASWTDQMFRFTMTIQNGGASSVKLGFGSTLDQPITDEGWGIDNVKVYEAQDGGTPGPFSVAENTANGQTVARITAGDVEGNTITYSITGGTGAAAFAINASTGIITVANSSLLDYETTTSFTLEVRATDNGSPNQFDTKTITINLTNVPENTAPTVNAAGPFSVAENAANNTVVGTMSATDPEGNAITWSITAGNTDNIFSINASGQIRVNSNTNLNYEWDNQYVLTIRATDNGFGALFGSRTVTINITDINEAPTFDTHTMLLAQNPYLRYNATTGNYYQYVSTVANYATATSTANATTLLGVGGYLATSTSAAENSYIRSLAGTAQIWLGGSDTTAEGVWRWVNGGSESGAQFWQGAGSGAGGSAQNGYYTNWNGATQPDNAGGGVGEDFMVMIAAGTWNDVVGTGTNAYVIEWNGTAVQAALAALQNGPYSVAENSAAGTSVGFVESYDPDAGDSRTYSITGGTGAGLFSVNASTGEVTVASGADLNFEGTNSYTLNMRVQDAAGLFGTRIITINLTDVNETPTLGAAGPFSFNENIAAGTSVTTMAGSDVDAGQSLSYSIQSGNTGGMFAIDAATGAVTFAGSPNYEAVSSYNLVIRVTDDGAGTLFAERTVTININDVNETPTLGAAGPFSFDENIAAGTAVTTMVGSDVDAGQSLTYSIQSGNTGGMFAIDAATGAVTFAGSPNYEAVSSYNLVIRVTDNGAGTLFAERTVTININDVNDAPTLGAAGPFSFNENIAGGTAVTTMVGADVEGNALTYSIQGGNTGGMFAIDAATGAITFAGSPNFEAVSSYNLVIRVTDAGAGNAYAEQTVAININDLNEAPTLATAGPVQLDDDAPVGTSVITMAGSDVDAGQSLTYSIQSGNTGGAFAINATTGEITVAAALDYETLDTYSLVIRVTDNGTGNLFAQRTLVINLDNTNDAPTDITLSHSIVAENSASGFEIGTFSAVDEETFQIHSFSLVDDAGGRFGIEGNKLVVRGNLDYESGREYNITVRANDGAGGLFEKTMRIEVSDVFEPPSLSHIEPEAPPARIISDMLQEEDGKKIIFDEGYILGGALGTQDLIITTGLYGEAPQILRQNTTLMIHDFAADMVFEFSETEIASGLNPEANDTAMPQNESAPQPLHNMRAQLEALARIEQERGKEAAKDALDKAGKSYGQFKDVLTYHESKQAKLREALLKSS